MGVRRASEYALFQKKLTDHELQGLLDELSKRGVVKMSDGKLSYELPKTP